MIIGDKIFESWLGGLYRRRIAIEHRVSEGTVSNVVSERELRYGKELIDQLRSLSLGMSRSGLSFPECAVGHHITMMLRKMGSDEDQFDEMIQKVWELYCQSGLSPTNLVNEIRYLQYFRETNQNLSSFSVPMICENIKTKQEELKNLESSCANSRASIADKLQQKEAIEAELEFDKELKGKLIAKGLHAKEILETADLAAFVKKSGYSIREVNERFATFSDLDNACTEVNDKINEDRIKHDQLLKENEILEEGVSASSQRIRELEILEEMGFRLPEFKKLRSLLNEIADQGGMPTEENAAVNRFFQQLSEHLDDFVNLGKKIDDQKIQLQKLLDAIKLNSATLNLAPELVEMVRSLAREGYKKDHLEYLKRLIRAIPTSKSKDEVISLGLKNSGDATNTGEVIADENNKPIADVSQNQATATSLVDDGPYFPPTGSRSQLIKGGRLKPKYPVGVRQIYLRSISNMSGTRPVDKTRSPSLLEPENIVEQPPTQTQTQQDSPTIGERRRIN